MTGAEYIIKFLENKDVEIIFGYPGGSVLALYDALYNANKINNKITHILTRHEQGAIHAAEGYAQATRKTGVVFATSGPGATNIVTGLADAMIDSIPIFAITGQVGINAIGRDAFQEADMLGVTLSITKHNYLVRDIADLPKTLEEAWQIAKSGRFGPVLIDVPKNIFIEEIIVETETDCEKIYEQCKNEVANERINRKTINSSLNFEEKRKEISELLKQAQRPVILAGGGVTASVNAPELMLKFMQKFNIPAAVTLMGKSVLDSYNELALGMAGMHGLPAANKALTKSDLVIAVGTRFSDRTVGNPKLFGQLRGVIHADIDVAEISKNVKADIAIVTNSAEFFENLLKLEISESKIKQWAEWSQEVKEKKEELKYIKNTSHVIKMRELIAEVADNVGSGDNLRDNIVYVTDVGQHQMISAQELNVKSPKSFISSGGLGTMGFGLPAAIGAAFGRSDKKGRQQVILFSGDGGIQMNIQELATVKKVPSNVAVKIFILDNKRLGMVRQWQEKFYNEHYSQSILDDNPDFGLIAQAYNIKFEKIETRKDLEKIKEIIKSRENIIVHVSADPSENVFPMIPVGLGNDEMLFAKDFKK